MKLFRRLPVVGAAALLLIIGGSGLLAAAFSAGPAGADSTLGGFTVTSLAEAVTAQYEQPNFPLPATPSLEFDEGYASTSDNFGPSGTATASSLYPGQVVANAGPELALLVPGAPLPPAPVWPVQATSEYPQTPNSGSTDEPGVNMDATSTTNGNTASATLGDDAATAGSNGADPTLQAPSSSGNPLAGSSAIIGIGNMSATSSSLAPSTTANAQASATDSGISILAGFITIGSVTSTAAADSDGTTGKLPVGHQPHGQRQRALRQPDARRAEDQHRPQDPRLGGGHVRHAPAGFADVAAPGRTARRSAAHPRPGDPAGELDGLPGLCRRQQRELRCRVVVSLHLVDPFGGLERGCHRQLRDCGHSGHFRQLWHRQHGHWGHVGREHPDRIDRGLG
jgi:hypothetical protein